MAKDPNEFDCFCGAALIEVIPEQPWDGIPGQEGYYQLRFACNTQPIIRDSDHYSSVVDEEWLRHAAKSYPASAEILLSVLSGTPAPQSEARR